MKPLHKNLVAGRWFTLSLAEQLGNIGSEFLRAKTWQSRTDEDRFRDAKTRFLELMDLTLSDPRWNSPRRREFARVREQAVEELEDAQDTKQSLQKYFDQFAFQARLKK